MKDAFFGHRKIIHITKYYFIFAKMVYPDDSCRFNFTEEGLTIDRV